MSDPTVLIYGSYGYTGDLVVRRAVMRGIRPVVAGRRGAKVNPQADDLGLQARVFGLDDPDAVAAELRGIDAVVNCAGPFVHTHEPLVEACCRTGTHYMDITGEIGVFESIAGRDDRATEAGVMLLPGIGFDVVPTDCLAVYLAERLPDADELELAFDGFAGVSKGTARTALENLGGAKVREDGVIREIPLGTRNRRIDFGEGEQTATAVPWGDVSTAYHSTGIEDVTVYAAVPAPQVWGMRATGWMAPLLGFGPVKSSLQRLVDATVTGPSDRTRRTAQMRVWGRVSRDGERATARLRTPEPYEFTVRSVLAVLERVADGDTPVGFQTPASAYGPDLVTAIDDVVREDVGD